MDSKEGQVRIAFDAVPSNVAEHAHGFKPAPELNSVCERRVLILCALVGMQAVLLKFTIHPQSLEYERTYAALGMAKQPAVYFLLALAMLISTHLSSFWRALLAFSGTHTWKGYLVLQLLCYVAIFAFAGKLMPTDFLHDQKELAGSDGTWQLLLLLSVAGTVMFSLLAVGPLAYWVHFWKTEKATLLLAAAFAIGALWIGALSQYAWNDLSVWTIEVCRRVLQVFYADVQADFSTRTLGTPEFSVEVNFQCSGYEGIGLIVVFLTWYLLAFKSEVRFPNSLLLFPAGIAVIWCVNAIRIAALIALGSSVSPRIAMEGFHSSAGWISFITVCLGLIYCTRRIGFFAVKNGRHGFSIDRDKALIIPLIVALAVMLLTSALSTEFPWLYPFRVIATGVSIWLLWGHFKPTAWRVGQLPIMAGAVAFLLWIWLLPPSPEKDEKFARVLFDSPVAVSTCWLTFRIVGIAVVTPIAEELAFREYLPALFPRRFFDPENRLLLQWIPMAASALLFGVLHSSWVAGTAAGLIYYLVRQRSGKVWDAIAAHMTTNLLLVVYVLVFGYWSCW